MANITPTSVVMDRMPAILITWTGFDTNGDVGLAFDSWKTNNFYGNLYEKATAIVSRTAGANAIDVDVNVSLDDSKYEVTNLNNFTAHDVYKYETPVGDNVEIPWRHWKVDIVSIGVGNTLDLELWLYK